MAGLLFQRKDVEPEQWRVDLFEAFLLLGDELADQAARDLFAPGKNHRQSFLRMRQALEHGTKDLEGVPDSLAHLIREAHTDPSWLDREQLEQGAAVCRRLGLDAMSVLGDLALLGGYANAEISKPLAFTGALQGSNTFDRLGETSQFWVDVTRPHAMDVGGKGFTSAIRVRMMHAIVRQRLTNHPKWKIEDWGVPINKADAVSTNVAFSMAMIYGVRMLGYQLSDEEIESVLHLWRYIGFLMGDDVNWLPQTVDEGLRCLNLIYLSNRNEPDDDSLSLAKDYLNSFEEERPEMSFDEKIIRKLLYRKHLAYAEYLIPPNLHRRLKIPSSDLSWLLIPTVQRPLIFGFEHIRKRIPAIDQWVEERGARQQEKIIDLMMRGREAAYVPGEKMKV